MLAALVVDWRTAALDARWRALAEYAERLTLAPHAIGELDLAPLRAVGLSDAAIHDAIQVIAYFNYINRVADGVHVELEPNMPPREP
ncbi:MAG: peroxidase [Planctomycetes bacterium]|nr:peroxidase [Planctomycetota bacterium]